MVRNGWVQRLHISHHTLSHHLSEVIDYVCDNPAARNLTALQMSLLNPDAPLTVVRSLSNPRAIHRPRSIRLEVSDYLFIANSFPDAASPLHLLLIPSLQYLCIVGLRAVEFTLVRASALDLMEECLRCRAQSGAPPLRLCTNDRANAIGTQHQQYVDEMRSLLSVLSPATAFVHCHHSDSTCNDSRSIGWEVFLLYVLVPTLAGLFSGGHTVQRRN